MPAPQLSDLAQGDVQEQFESAFNQVMKNIADAGTDPDKPRKIVIELEFKTFGGDREQVGLKITTKSQLQPPKSAVTGIHIKDVDTPNPIGVEFDRD